MSGIKAIKGFKIKAVIFDWAGTLIDHGCQAPMEAFELAFQEILDLKLSREKIAPFMGMAKREHIKCILQEIWDDLIVNQQQTSEIESLTDKIYDSFQEHLRHTVLNHLDITPHTFEIIKKLRENGIAIGSTTGYNSETIMQIFDKLGKETIDKLPSTFVASDNVPASGRRPAPSMIYQNLASLGLNCKTNQVIKVGDTLLDIDEGANAGCWTVGVINTSSDMGLTKEELDLADQSKILKKQIEIAEAFRERGADFVINNLSELLNVISEIEQG